MWGLVRKALRWMQEWCLTAVRFLFTVTTIALGSPPFRESPPDSPPQVVFRLLRMIQRTKPTKILVLDLDETLIHASYQPLLPTHYDVVIRTGNSMAPVYVCERPYLHYFLMQVSQWFKVAIFTASMKDYALPIINKLDRSRVIVKKYFREDCLEKDGQYIKNLERLGKTDGYTGRKLNKIEANCIIIDNHPPCYQLNPNNAVPISSFQASHHSTDRELLKLLPLLEALHVVGDVRSILELRNNPAKTFVDRITR
eukprot:Sspe_Gene.82489::Locus_54069_Transcript_1_1_Confidence_1.000_Length_891::g.82489::m.82489/K15731/CTDSP; carboxy-terminal domain RNA polymerase II polypeptide A small phosphatase